ncbi:MAG: phosphatidate cytidylyltransferase [Bacilli bacterium]|nr:phosphatidate cytidylyltransferase [Bacilli bacterium]
MLKRCISAIIMLAIFIPVILIGGIPFQVVCVLLALVAYKELIDLKESHSKIPLEIVICSMIVLGIIIVGATCAELSFQSIVLLFWILFLPTLFYKGKKYQTNDAFFLASSTLFLGSAFHSLIFLRMQSIHYVVYLLCITIATDTFAYLVGSAIGKHKIAPVISPKKSLEGCIGGSLFGTILPTLYYIHFIGNQKIWMVGLITLVISTMGQLGDLFFSKIKRENHIKDFSDLIPGHGGILDRADSTLFAVLTLMLLKSFI